MPPRWVERNSRGAGPRVPNSAKGRIWFQEERRASEAAEGRWDVLLTDDQNIKYQQNMAGRSVAILILRAKSNRMVDLLPLMPVCSEALLSIEPGQVVEVGPL